MENQYIVIEDLGDTDISILHTNDGRIIINKNCYKYDLIASLLGTLTKLDDDVINRSPEEIAEEWKQWSDEPMAEAVEFVWQCMQVERYRRVLMRRNSRQAPE